MILFVFWQKVLSLNLSIHLFLQATKQKPPQKIVAPPKKIMPSLGPVSQSKSFMVHTLKQDSLITTTIGKPTNENEPLTSDQVSNQRYWG